ncbi:hypothetical protein Vi05172_g6781 [Venturia inaequalis]|nr:hypothetical protein Vi05172_g6781 [Venturia inaequalis]
MKFISAAILFAVAVVAQSGEMEVRNELDFYKHMTKRSPNENPLQKR